MNNPDTADLIRTAANLLDGSQRSREEAQVKVLMAIAIILDEMAGPYCGHGERRKSCPYFHADGE